MTDPVPGSPPLSTADLAWLRLQTPENPSHTLATLVTARRIDSACLKSRIEDRLMVHDRFRQRVDTPHLPFSRPRWRECDDFRLADHFIETTLKADESSDDLEQLVAQLRSEPLPEGRPLWQVHSVVLPHRGSAVILRVHAAVADCTSVPLLAFGLLDDSPAPPSARRIGLEPMIAPEKVLDRAGKGSAATKTFCNLITLRPDVATPFAGAKERVRHTVWSEPASLEALRELARKQRCSPTDLVIFAVATALRRGLHRHDKPAEDVELRAVLPWSLRRPEESLTGSRLALGLTQLPIGASPAPERLAQVQRQVERLFLSPDNLVVLGRDPFHGISMTEIEERSLRLLGQRSTLTLAISDGPENAVELCGAEVTEIRWHPTLGAGTALDVVVVDYAGSVRFGVTCDEALPVDPGRLAADMAAASFDL